jgi:hypothetical protein
VGDALPKLLWLDAPGGGIHVENRRRPRSAAGARTSARARIAFGWRGPALRSGTAIAALPARVGVHRHGR